MKRCSRFRADGSVCANTTANGDGWCRQDGCGGFLRPEPAAVAHHVVAPGGTAKHIRETGDVPVGDITIEDAATIHIAAHAVDSFRSRHGGGTRDAEVQLRAMLEDFLLKSARRVTTAGSLRLAREGYVLTLSRRRDSITGYSTVHRERTWEQIKAGVKSRYKGIQRGASGVAPERGSPVSLSEFAASLDPAAVHLTARVRRSYAKIAGLGGASDDELDAAIRAACTEFTAGHVVQRDDGLFEVYVAGRIWLVSPDCLSLYGVRDEPSQP